METVEARIIKLEAEVKVLKEMVQALISRPAYPERTGPAVIGPITLPPTILPPTIFEPLTCSCPASTIPHARGPGCQDTWITCDSNSG